eukprot:gb/GFBE01079003.1/.p1 GENE.gb/GFBE01079003.1/~~gb/GFBE01079003.1/.p1  ORF type:complete len:411 (+),score=67.14 gb/GFBE01079003.1/:1-1233(+)
MAHLPTLLTSRSLASTCSSIAWDAYSSRPTTAATSVDEAKQKLGQLLEAPTPPGSPRQATFTAGLPRRNSQRQREETAARPSSTGRFGRRGTPRKHRDMDIWRGTFDDIKAGSLRPTPPPANCDRENELRKELELLKQEVTRKERALKSLRAETAALADLVPRAPSHWVNQDLSHGHALQCEWHDGQQAILSMLKQASTHELCCGRDGLFDISSVKTLKVWRVENPMLWKQYANKASEMAERHRLLKLDCPRIAVDKFRYEADYPDCLQRQTLNAALNEVRLWHGTKVWNTGRIVQEGFDERVCCLQGMFGAGLYFANETCKAGQYAQKSEGGSIGSGSRGSHWFFLSRVLLGRSHFTREAMPETRRAPDNCDSVIYTPTQYARVGHHTEFIVYDRFQCYPEYLVEAVTK